MKKILIYNLIMIILSTSCIFGEVVDFIVSDGMGPYRLSQTPKSCVVSMGKSIINPLEYNINEEKRTIFFVHAPQTGKIIKVSYTPVETVSENNISINSYLDENNKIGIIDGTYSKNVYGNNLDMKFAIKNTGDEFDTDNIASSINYNKNFGKLKLGATYTTTGDNLNNVQNYKTENDLLSVLAAYNENNIAIDSKYIKFENSGKTVTENKLAYYNSTYKINLICNTENTDTEKKDYINYSIENDFKNLKGKFYSQINKASTNSDSEKYGVEVTGNNFFANASSENTFQNGQKTTIQTMGGKINLKDLTADAVSTNTENSTEKEQKQTIKIGVKGNNSYLNAEYNSIYSGTEKNIESSANSGWNLGKHTQISGTYKNIHNNQSVTDSFEGNLAYNSDIFDMNTLFKKSQNNQDTIYKEFLSNLTYKPNPNLLWTVNYLNKELAEENTFSSLKLTGNYNIDKFNIYAMYIDRNSRDKAQDTTSARLTWQLFKFLEFSSQWTENPENNESWSDKTEMNYGMKWSFGDLGLSGNLYECKNSENIIDQNKYDIGVSAKIFGGNLSGNLIINKNFGNSPDYWRHYILGYTKNISNRLNLSLSGEYKERNQNYTGFSKESITGNLTIGINF